MNEELWFPEFGLRNNPFIHADKREEICDKQQYETVETEATKMVKILIESGGRTIVYGPNGCGKSTALYSMKPEDAPSPFPIVIGPKSMKDLTSELLVWRIRLKKEDMDILNMMYSPHLQKWITPFTPPKKDVNHPTKYVCWYRGCRVSPRCDFPLFESGVTFDNVTNYLPNNVFCQLAEWIIPLIFRRLKVKTFLFDVPDDVGGESSVRYFKDFMQELCEKTHGTVVLMATDRQYRALIKTEFFRRWDRRRFPKMKAEELKEIYDDRLAVVRDPQINYPNPLSENALDYIILTTDQNPRNMIRNVKFVLDKMKVDGCKESVDVDYVQKAVQNVGGIVSDEELLQSVVNEFEATGVRDITAKEICKRMRERDPDIRINEKNVGWMMRRLKYRRIRGRPTATYKIR
jgi:hypothetical protein